MFGLSRLANSNAAQLAEAFPRALRDKALEAGRDASRDLCGDGEWQRFPVMVGGEVLQIPDRLNLASGISREGPDRITWLMRRALVTRSNNGYDRQAAARGLLVDPQPWTAPFLVALVGEYVVEILDDTEAAMSPALHGSLRVFIDENPQYWYLTKQRIASYWNEYQRWRTSRSNYVGTRLIRLLENPLD